MNETHLDLVWWITAVELPAMAGLFWLGWRNWRAAHEDIDALRSAMEASLSAMRHSLDAYKFDVAKSYASIAYLKDVEERLTKPA